MKVTIPDEISNLTFDTSRMEQVLHNLLDNAVKYTLENGTIQISVQQNKEQNQILFCIADNGLGISETDLPYIFDRFYRTDRARTRQQGGTGLGLSIVKQIILAHNGKIWAQSIPEKETKIFFTIPILNLKSET